MHTTFAEFLRQHRDVFVNRRDLVRNGTFKYHGTHFDTVNGTLLADTMEHYMLGCVMDRGPKVFRPSQQELELLELIDINIELKDYVQPFKSVVVDFPDDYLARCTVACPTAKAFMAPSHTPQWMILHHEHGTVLSDVMFDSMTSVKSLLKASHGTVESNLARLGEPSKEWDNLPVTDDEWEVVRRLIRAGMNYMLLVDEVGHRKLDDPPGVRKLRRSLIPKFRELASQEPTYFALAQQVKLCSHERSDRSDPTERTVKPHHRRGHYRMQPVGVGRTQLRRVRVPPVFVNSHKFFGDLSDTNYEASVS